MLEFRVISQFWEATTAERMKIDPYNCQRMYFSTWYAVNFFARGLYTYTHCCRAVNLALTRLSCFILVLTFHCSCYLTVLVLLIVTMISLVQSIPLILSGQFCTRYKSAFMFARLLDKRITSKLAYFPRTTFFRPFPEPQGPIGRRWSPFPVTLSRTPGETARPPPKTTDTGASASRGKENSYLH